MQEKRRTIKSSPISGSSNHFYDRIASTQLLRYFRGAEVKGTFSDRHCRNAVQCDFLSSWITSCFASWQRRYSSCCRQFAIQSQVVRVINYADVAQTSHADHSSCPALHSLALCQRVHTINRYVRWRNIVRHFLPPSLRKASYPEVSK